MTSFSAAYTDEAIYIDFLVRCNYLRAENYVDQVARERGFVRGVFRRAA